MARASAAHALPTASPAAANARPSLTITASSARSKYGTDENAPKQSSSLVQCFGRWHDQISVHAGCERAQDVGVDRAERLVDETSTAQQQVGRASHGRHDGAIEHVPQHAPCAGHGATCEAEALLEEKLRKDEGHDHWRQRCFEDLLERRRLWTGLATRPQGGSHCSAWTTARAGDDYRERSEQAPPSHPVPACPCRCRKLARAGGKETNGASDEGAYADFLSGTLFGGRPISGRARLFSTTASRPISNSSPPFPTRQGFIEGRPLHAKRCTSDLEPAKARRFSTLVKLLQPFVRRSFFVLRDVFTATTYLTRVALLLSTFHLLIYIPAKLLTQPRLF
eukprot:scaffold4512_cov76-Phaeocystis_antarctica.AAC.2